MLEPDEDALLIAGMVVLFVLAVAAVTMSMFIGMGA